MNTTVNVIGDVAGRYETLLELLAKLPPADFTVLCGDMVDRGPRNLDVLNLARNGRTPQGGKLVAVAGNHEFLMLDGQSGKDGYSTDIWLSNGGRSTKKELDALSPEELRSLNEWVNELPVYLEFDDLLVTHAPVQPTKWYPRYAETDKIAFTWPRNKLWQPLECGATGQRLFNVYGHNGVFDLFLDESKQPYACCIDDSHNRNLAAFCWPSMQVVSIDQVEPRFY